MSRYISADRPLVLNTPLGNDVLLPVKVSGREAMSAPYRFKLDMVAEESLDFDRLVGREVTLTIAIPGVVARRVHGVLCRVKEGRRVPGPNGPTTFLRYRAELVAPLWRLSRRIQSRVIRRDNRLHVSVPDVLQQVLHDEWRLRVTFRLSGQYAPRDHVIQYRESDLAFVSRLMEEEGIFYYFLQYDDRCEMIVTDSPTGCRPAEGAIAFDEVEGGSRGEPRIRDWEKSQSVRAIRHTLRDYSFQKPHSWLEGQQARLVPENVAIGKVEHLLNRGYEVNGTEMFEVYDYPGGYAHRFDGIGAGGEATPADLESLSTDKDRAVRLRMQEEAAKCLKVTGGGHVPDFAPGSFFRLDKHGRGDGVYLLTRVEHEASQPVMPDKNDPTKYSNRFTCLPEGLPHRPCRKTPRPRIDGTQTAVVCGPAGAKTFVDHFGRIKVQFHWDRAGKRDATSSCWVRVAQTWAGYRIGAFFWPRVGDEVVVSFEEGDPDRPLVVGSVYNAQNMPPLELPDNVLTTGFKSGSLGTDPLKDFNALLFHDEPGHEVVCLHGQTQTLQNDEIRKNVTVGRCLRTVVGGPLFSVPGSGSGGGFTPEWENFSKAWGNIVQYGYGHALLNCAGFTVNSTVGAFVTATCNPLMLADVLGTPMSSATFAAASPMRQFVSGGMRSVLGGFCSYTVGDNTLMGIGPSLLTGHGWDVKNFAPLTSAQKALAWLIAASQLALTMAPAMGAAYGIEKKFIQGREQVGWGERAEWIFETTAGVLLAAFAMTERVKSIADATEEKEEQAQLDKADIKHLVEGHGPEQVTRAHVNSLATKVAQLRTALMPGAEDIGENLVVHGPYNLHAQDMSLTAQAEADGGHGQISIDALGRGRNDGQLSLRASGTATLKAAQQNRRPRSQIILQPVTGDQFGVNVESSDGIRLRATTVDDLNHSPMISAKNRTVLLRSGDRGGDTGPWIRLDSDAGTLTLGASTGEGPRIVIGQNSVQIFGTGGTSVTVAGDVQVQ
jgi:type VI secretion system secreted protein VgrG